MRINKNLCFSKKVYNYFYNALKVNESASKILANYINENNIYSPYYLKEVNLHAERKYLKSLHSFLTYSKGKVDDRLLINVLKNIEIFPEHGFFYRDNNGKVYCFDYNYLDDSCNTLNSKLFVFLTFIHSILSNID